MIVVVVVVAVVEILDLQPEFQVWAYIIYCSQVSPYRPLL